jgi:hypothetical protein
MDVEAVASLAKYYADRIRSVTHIEIFRRTFSLADLELARGYLEEALAAWDRLCRINVEHYAYVPELVRFKNGYKVRLHTFRKYIDSDLDEIDRMKKEFLERRRNENLPPEYEWPMWDGAIIGHMTPVKARPCEALTVTATNVWALDPGTMFLCYRDSSTPAFKRIPMTRHGELRRTWVGEIPAADMAAGRLIYYFYFKGKGTPYGGTLAYRDPYVVNVTNDHSKPVVTHVPPAGPVRGTAVNLTVNVRDNAEIERVRVHYRRLPSYCDWIPMEMERVGDGSYEAAVPLTPEGIMYYFEASDSNGNVAHHPHFMKQTPYYAIDSWNPAR